MPPSPTVDVIIEISGGIVLVERRFEPLGWALPGGFVETGEWTWQAAVREAREETGLDVTLTELFGVYSDPGRDRRGHTISTVYIGRAEGTPRGGDDAKRAQAFARTELPALVFDHSLVVADYLRYRDHGERPPPRR